MIIKKDTRNISINQEEERISLFKKPKDFKVAIVDQNFLKRTIEEFKTQANQEFFLLKSKIGIVERNAGIQVFLNGQSLSEQDYEFRTSATNSSKSELYIKNYIFDEGELLQIIY